MANNRIYIPTFISSINYNPARVLPRIYFYNGTKTTDAYFIQGYNSGSTTAVQTRELNVFPYFDNYSGNTPDTGSRSLLFNNETAAYGVAPSASLYTEYWEDYVSLLYNPKTRLLDCSAIIPLADYFKMELNDIVEFRGNYYHLRAINNYNIRTSECDLQLLGPVLPEAIQAALPPVLDCNFDISVGSWTTTTTSTTTSTTSTTTTSTTTTTTLAPTTTTTTVPPTTTTTTVSCNFAYSSSLAVLPTTTTTTSTTSTTTTAAPTTTTTEAPTTTTTSTTTVGPNFANFLVVAGGGGGGVSFSTTGAGGGGGAGGLTSGSLSLDTSTWYPVIVGSGGTRNANGLSSSFNSTYSALGGGYGGSLSSVGANGGSGGGGGGTSATQVAGGSGTSGQGNDGGFGRQFTGASQSGGGGGGARIAGGNYVNNGGVGGGGIGGSGSAWLNGKIYAGGGGGGYSGTGDLAGVASDGGGKGACFSGAPNNFAGTNGTPNTGGGGGGGYSIAYDAGQGGSGIVIVRYPNATPLFDGGTIFYSGSYTYHEFTASGWLSPIGQTTTTTSTSTTTTVAPTTTTTTIAPTTTTTTAAGTTTTTTEAPTTTTTTAGSGTTTTTTAAPTTTTTTVAFYSFLLNSTDGLGTGPAACADYAAFNRQTYYASFANGPTIVNGTFLYTDSALTTPIPDGYRSDGTTYWNFQGGDTGDNGNPCNTTTTTSTSTTTTTTAAPTTTTTTTAAPLTTYYELDDCVGTDYAFTAIAPDLGTGQRYVLPGGTPVYYTYTGASQSSATPPTGYNGSIQKTSFTGCP